LQGCRAWLNDNINSYCMEKSVNTSHMGQYMNISFYEEEDFVAFKLRFI